MARAKNSTMAKERGKGTLLALLVLVAVLVAGAFLLPVEQLFKEQPTSADLCPADASRIAGSATLLLDLRKPLHSAAPSALLRQVSRDLSARTELQVFTLSGDARAPRRFVQRLCKPYDNADLTIQTAKDQRQGVRDCDDPPAQLPRQLRDAVIAFCSQREALAVRIDRLANETPSARPVVNAYLIEALEETKRAFADRPQPWSLYLFSDMVQHAAWYSHLDLDWTQWRFADFEPLRSARQPPLQPAPASDLRIKVFYLPRQGLTEPARQRRAHQGFWRAYFSGASLAFEDAPPLPAYSALPLMSGPAVDESDQELAQLERQREETERLLEQMEQEQAALDEQRRQDAASEQQRQAREAELRRLEQAVAAAQQRQQEQDAAEAEMTEQLDPSDDTTSPPPVESTEEEAAAQSGPSAASGSATDAPAGEAPSSQPEAVASAAADPAASAPCPAILKPQFLASLEVDGYPGNQRVNYGAGVIAVRYTLGDDGLTLDEEVLLQRDLSRATRPAFLEVLAEDTLADVRAWEFEFEQAAEPLCSKSQQQTATFTYRSKCVGTPVPSCRTVRADVAVRPIP